MNKQKIYSGEPLGVVGIFRIDDVVSVDAEIHCIVLDANDHQLVELNMDIDTEHNAYSCTVDTTNMVGHVSFLFAIVGGDGTYIYSQNRVRKDIYPVKSLAPIPNHGCGCKKSTPHCG